ncbi:hypothetical protein SARC_08660 [Sphaeroforma arctica JP610]|uniref:Uncharacterized protein n=1 Tax=Sphaeroforma arctica JP610 TaxID=667725 RepID=A0A0L0FQV0_9EUKA|nr:hypothetical protein SARC_08660 [Sphaeroforma arctica JP610]KNC78926.1 hypothetical protein SARC_08660 [Sphaeroforma arctica JP610]|eukprot:XP_014152828.1 hypothetical protein SARC_08660 [Sphaeroforma arctica JP610]
MNVETPPASGGEFLGANSIEMTGIESRTGLRTHNIADNDGDISAMTTKSNADDDAHQHAMLRAPSPGPMRGDADGLQSVGALPPTSPSLGGRGVRGEDVMGAAHGRNGSQMHFPAKGGNGRRDPTTSEQDMQQVEEALFA